MQVGQARGPSVLHRFTSFYIVLHLFSDHLQVKGLKVAEKIEDLCA